MENINSAQFSRVLNETLNINEHNNSVEFNIKADGKHGISHTYKVKINQQPDGSADVNVERRTKFFSKGHTSETLRQSIGTFANDILSLPKQSKDSIATLQPKNMQEVQSSKTLLQKMDNLYQKHNIIGYTQGGGANQKPTVYYRSNSGSWGHITQEHNHTNVGREPPIKDPNYVFGNKTSKTGKQQLYEMSPKHGLSHTSRGEFIAVNQNDAQKIQDLSTAETDHQKIKPRYQGEITTLKKRADI